MLKINWELETLFDKNYVNKFNTLIHTSDKYLIGHYYRTFKQKYYIQGYCLNHNQVFENSKYIFKLKRKYIFGLSRTIFKGTNSACEQKLSEIIIKKLLKFIPKKKFKKRDKIIETKSEFTPEFVKCLRNLYNTKSIFIQNFKLQSLSLNCFYADNFKYSIRAKIIHNLFDRYQQLIFFIAYKNIFGEWEEYSSIFVDYYTARQMWIYLVERETTYELPPEWDKCNYISCFTQEEMRGEYRQD